MTLPASGRRHERALLDAIEAIGPAPFSDDVWRITGRGRDPLRGSAAGGRWSPAAEFEVLYTSLEREGALAEIGYRLSLEPVWPSRAQHDLNRIAVKTRRSLRLIDMATLTTLGIDTARYASFDYTATQAVAAAAHFLEFDGIIVPSARSSALNLVVFLEYVTEDNSLVVAETSPVDWTSWRSRTSGE